MIFGAQGPTVISVYSTMDPFSALTGKSNGTWYSSPSTTLKKNGHLQNRNVNHWKKGGEKSLEKDTSWKEREMRKESIKWTRTWYPYLSVVFWVTWKETINFVAQVSRGSRISARIRKSTFTGTKNNFLRRFFSPKKFPNGSKKNVRDDFLKERNVEILRKR